MSIVEKIKNVINDVKENIDIKKTVSKVINETTHMVEKNEIIKEIEANDSIIILRHMRPDGDCIGSTFGLREVLRKSFPNKKIYSVGDGVPEYLAFLGEEDEVSEETFKESLVIVVDTATSKRVVSEYENLKEKCKKVIKIDHHIPVDSYGDINYVRDDFPACCQIIADLVMTSNNKLIMTEHAATCLYTGLVTDTGRFRFRSVDSKTFKIASFLLEHNIDTEKIYTHLNTKSKESFKLQGYIYQNFKVTENGVAYAYITKRLMKKFNASVEDASNLVNCMDSVKGSFIWILFVQYDNEIRVRLRSRHLPVVEIGEKFNGGGHANACGATIKTKKELKQLLEMADNKLKDFKKDNKGLF